MRYFKIWLAVIVLAIALAGNSGAAEKVNINTANSDELQTLVGIGPSLAGKIIAYREANGPFRQIEDIMKVSGIKEGVFAGIKDFITVGSEAAANPDEADGDQNETAAHESPAAEIYSGPAALKRVPLREDLAVSAGRPRAATIHAPVAFQANLVKAGAAGKVNYCWAFGDGAGARGERASHVYQFPGRYVVIVKAKQNGLEATGRTTVEVTEPALRLERDRFGRETVTVTNQSETEVNLGDWSVVLGEWRQILPTDTILIGRGRVTIPLIASEQVLELRYPDGSVYATALSPALEAQVRRWRAELAQAQAELAALTRPTSAFGSEAVALPPETIATATVYNLAAAQIPKVIELAKPPSAWMRLINFFKK